jgi:Ni/Co efflux regulator RcnB
MRAGGAPGGGAAQQAPRSFGGQAGSGGSRSFGGAGGAAGGERHFGSDGAASGGERRFGGPEGHGASGGGDTHRAFGAGSDHRAFGAESDHRAFGAADTHRAFGADEHRAGFGADHGHGGDAHGRFTYHGREFAARHAEAYRWPHGYAYHRYWAGRRLPRAFWRRDYYVYDYADFGIDAPPPGYQWVRYGPDLLLISVATGEVAQSVNGAYE